MRIINFTNYIYFIFILILVPVNAYAYLDPATGGMLFAAFVGIISTLFFLAKGIIVKLTHLPSVIQGKKIRQKKQYSIVFYSEGPQYWNVFKPVVEELDKRSVPFAYLSSSESDPGLSYNLKNMETRFIGKGNKGFFVMNTLEAEIVIMTTPGLDVLQLKRSKGVKHYCHIPHSTGGCWAYHIYGLDYYDSVLTGGIEDIKLIKELESKRNIKPKYLKPVGCTYMDVLRKQLCQGDPGKFFTDKKTVLISPTWGEHNLLCKFGNTLLSKILSLTDFAIVIRPHPQSFVSDKITMDKLQIDYPNSDRIVWDKNSNNLKALNSADIMISDFSGVIFDFIFLFERPVLTFAGEYDKRGRDDMDSDREPWMLRVLDKIGKIINENDIRDICELLKKTENNKIDPGVIAELKNDMDAYPGESGKRCADEILKIVSDKITV